MNQPQKKSRIARTQPIPGRAHPATATTLKMGLITAILPLLVFGSFYSNVCAAQESPSLQNMPIKVKEIAEKYQNGLATEALEDVLVANSYTCTEYFAETGAEGGSKVTQTFAKDPFGLKSYIKGGSVPEVTLLRCGEKEWAAAVNTNYKGDTYTKYLSIRSNEKGTELYIEWSKWSPDVIREQLTKPITPMSHICVNLFTQNTRVTSYVECKIVPAP